MSHDVWYGLRYHGGQVDPESVISSFHDLDYLR